MDHSQFKSNQTAASYVAEGLDEQTQEAFELHMMGCTECVGDVETWRAIRSELHGSSTADRNGFRRQRPPALTDWRMAASLVGAGVVGAAGGWVGKTTQVADVDSSQTVIFNLPAVARGGDECTPLRLATDTKVAVVRVSGVSRDSQVVAMDSEGKELARGEYGVRTQPDGSQLVRIDAQHLKERSVHLQTRATDGATEPIGCVSGEIPSPDSASEPK